MAIKLYNNVHEWLDNNKDKNYKLQTIKPILESYNEKQQNILKSFVDHNSFISSLDNSQYFGIYNELKENINTINERLNTFFKYKINYEEKYDVIITRIEADFLELLKLYFKYKNEQKSSNLRQT